MRVLAALILLTSLAQAQTTWYVDVNGTAPGSGSLAAPYTSIQYALDQPSTGTFDIVSAAAGTYVENIVVPLKGTRVVGSAGPGACIIQAAAPGVVVDLGDGLGISGFTIRGGYGSGAADGVEVGLNFFGLIDRCVIIGNEGNGVLWESLEYLGRIHQCTIEGNGGAGLLQAPYTGVQLVNTVIWNNGQPSIYGFGSHGIGVFLNNDAEDPAFQSGCYSSGAICGNFAWDPLFVDPSNGDYRLSPGSPCIDTGNIFYVSLDPDGSPADVGAFTYDPAVSPGPTVYCTSTVNSQGCTPSIGFTGSPSASGSAFNITCSSVVNNKQGLLFYGYQSKALPYQGGTLCVSAPVKRTPVQDSAGNPPPADCSGLYGFDFQALLQGGSDPNLAVGEVVYAQYWYRDPNQLTGFTTGRSDALTFLIQP